MKFHSDPRLHIKFLLHRFHCHIHLIPRRKGDVEDPKGGVRGVIPSKQKYERK